MHEETFKREKEEKEKQRRMKEEEEEQKKLKEYQKMEEELEQEIENARKMSMQARIAAELQRLKDEVNIHHFCEWIQQTQVVCSMYYF